VVGSCEHGNETSASRKGRGISWIAEWLLPSQGLCCIGIVPAHVMSEIAGRYNGPVSRSPTANYSGVLACLWAWPRLLAHAPELHSHVHAARYTVLVV
jgi:hypothetical protein